MNALVEFEVKIINSIARIMASTGMDAWIDEHVNGWVRTTMDEIVLSR